MKKKLAIKLRKFGRICPITGYREESIKVGFPVIVETDRGVEFGEIVSYERGLPKAGSKDVRLKKVLRYATPEDLRAAQGLDVKEKEAFDLGGEKIRSYELPIKLIAVEYLFDMKKAIFYYRVEEGITPNTKDVAKELQSLLKVKVDFKQLSPRDCARIFGGLGVCGRPLCCATWLEKPSHVTVKMVKDRGLTISPGRTSGLCGRLMCCLGYKEVSPP